MKSSFLLNTFIVLLADVSCASFVLFTNIFTLVRSVITPRLDYCSSLYFCLPSSRRVFLLILLFAKLTEHIPKYGHVSSYVLPILIMTIIKVSFILRKISLMTQTKLAKTKICQAIYSKKGILQFAYTRCSTILAERHS